MKRLSCVGFVSDLAIEKSQLRDITRLNQNHCLSIQDDQLFLTTQHKLHLSPLKSLGFSLLISEKCLLSQMPFKAFIDTYSSLSCVGFVSDKFYSKVTASILINKKSYFASLISKQFFSSWGILNALV